MFTQSLLQNSDANTIKGSVERITFHNTETGFCVLQVKIKDQPHLVPVIGKAILISVGESIEADGVWVKDHKYGKQFNATQLRIIPPSSLEEVEKYLGSGAVKGVGAKYAKILIDAFGESVLDVLDQDPERLLAVPGIGKKLKKKIIDGWNQQKSIRHIMLFLQAYGFGPARAVKIHKLYGDRTIELIRSNPYQLIQDIPGIGFKTADTIGEKLGIAKDSPMRAGAALKYLLQIVSEQGHCAAYKDALAQQAIDLLGLTEEVIVSAIKDEIEQGNIVQEMIDDREALFLASFYRAEMVVADQLKRLDGVPKWGEIDASKAIPWAEHRLNITLSDSQKLAITEALNSKLLIITGGPGVGKTTVVNSLLNILKAKKIKVSLCAPTGRAAKRLAETTKLPAKTIHRLLGYDAHTHRFQHDQYDPLDTDLVIVDESSMLDLMLTQSLLCAIPNHAALFLIGDVDQLPSVGPGAILSDLINSTHIPTVRLKEIFRQAASSQIIINAHRVNQGEMPGLTNETGQDFYFIQAQHPDEINEKIVRLVTHKIPHRFDFNPIRDIQVLVPMNRGSVGTVALNQQLQRELNGGAEPKLQRQEYTFAPYDKVMQLVNNYDKDVFNGDIGQVESINLEKNTMRVNFDGHYAEYASNDLDELGLAYAMSIHKSQGSEYPVVVIALSSQHERMLVRNLLYTAMTRGKKLVVLVGQTRALQSAVNTIQTGKRLTRLSARLQARWS